MADPENGAAALPPAKKTPAKKAPAKKAPAKKAAAKEAPAKKAAAPAVPPTAIPVTAPAGPAGSYAVPVSLALAAAGLVALVLSRLRRD